MRLIKVDHKLVRVDTRELGGGRVDRSERYGRSHVLSELNRPITDEEFKTLEMADIWRPVGRVKNPPTICFYVKRVKPRWVAYISGQENNEGDIAKGQWRPVGQPFTSSVVAPITGISDRHRWFMVLPSLTRETRERAWLDTQGGEPFLTITHAKEDT